MYWVNLIFLKHEAKFSAESRVDGWGVEIWKDFGTISEESRNKVIFIEIKIVLTLSKGQALI